MYRLSVWWKQTRETLFGGKSRNFGVFLFFFAVSAGFWVIQTLDETFDTEITIPLQLVDVPDDVVITSPLPNHLRVTVRDKGTGLLRYWHHDFFPIEVSFTNYGNGAVSGRVRVSQSDIQKAVQARVLGATKVQAIRPDTLEFYYNHGLNASVPVSIVGEVEADPHFYLLDLRTIPSEVKVFAAANTLDTLRTVPTMPVSLKKLRENTTIEVDLASIRGAKVEPTCVKVVAKVDVWMENTMDVPIVSMNFPGNKQLRTFPSTVHVTYTVGYAKSKEITPDSLVSLVTYEEILGLQRQGRTMLPVKLKSVPEGVNIVRIEPQEVDFLVEDVSEAE